jgi:hypothetical protein
MTRCRAAVVGFAIAVSLAIGTGGLRLAAAAADALPSRLTDEEFWRLSEEMSESDGYFRSDNLLSNELYYPEVIAPLVARVKPGRVYLGVGPEQNFNYIAAIKPTMAFITDIRRGNLHAQLMYKALFELSADRAEFISRLFIKPRPKTLTAQSSAMAIMQAFWDVDSSAQAEFDRNLAAVVELLTKTHHLPLSKDDLDGIDYVYRSFYWYGPQITYNSSSNNSFGRGAMASYAQLMVATDGGGVARSFLASDESFRVVKDLEARNLIVPIVGNFGGARALKAVGQYVREHDAVVGAFYLSNVEQYLVQDGIWDAFCRNVASMPLDADSTFIRSRSGGAGAFQNALGEMQSETRKACGAAGAAGAAR